MSDADGEKVAATDEENVFLESNEEDDTIASVSSAAPCKGGITSTLYSAVPHNLSRTFIHLLLHSVLMTWQDKLSFFSQSVCSGRNLQFTIGLHSMTSESINQISSNTEVDRGLAAAGWRSAEPHY